MSSGSKTCSGSPHCVNDHSRASKESSVQRQVTCSVELQIPCVSFVCDPCSNRCYLRVNKRNHEVNQVTTKEPERIPSSQLKGIGFCPAAWDVITFWQLHNSKYYHLLYNSLVFPEKLQAQCVAPWNPFSSKFHTLLTCCEQIFPANQNFRQTESLSQHVNIHHCSLEISQKEALTQLIWSQQDGSTLFSF